MQYTTAATGLPATAATDLWGASKNLLLYVKPTTLRETANGYAVLTSRGSIQRVVGEFATFYQDRLDAYRARGQYPVTGQVEIRVGGLDQAGDVDVPGAQPTALSAVRPRADHPEWDVAVWFDVLTFPTAPHSHAFYRELEAFFFRNYTGSYATTRAEWSKGWAYTAEAAGDELYAADGRTVRADQAVHLPPCVPTKIIGVHLNHASRVAEFRARLPSAPTYFHKPTSALNAHDPHRIFSNAFLDELLPAR